MIENDKQLENSKKWIKVFANEIEKLQNSPLGDDHPLLRQAQIEGMESVREELKQEVAEYERLSGMHGL